MRANSCPVWDLVIEDMRSRDQEGQRRYGVRLRAHNGRDALQDAYEEALDLAVYLKQAIVERRSADGSPKDSLEAKAKEYVDTQLATMRKYGSAPSEMSGAEYRGLISDVAKAMGSEASCFHVECNKKRNNEGVEPDGNGRN